MAFVLMSQKVENRITLFNNIIIENRLLFKRVTSFLLKYEGKPSCDKETALYQD